MMKKFLLEVLGFVLFMGGISSAQCIDDNFWHCVFVCFVVFIGFRIWHLGLHIK